MTEKLYTDFTNKVLPAIQEGLVITQEYFTELFSRYVKYLIITDIVTIVGVLLIATALIVGFKKFWEFSKTERLVWKFRKHLYITQNNQLQTYIKL